MEKAELAIISSSEMNPGGVDVYHTCLNFEVKVMECSNTAYTGLDGCVICTGVLHFANKISELDGTPVDPSVKQGQHESEELGVLAPTLLTSGVYEALLYTVYSPESEIDITLVGKVCMTLHVPQLAIPLPVSNLKHWPECFDLVKFNSEPDCRSAFTHYWMRFHACCKQINEYHDHQQQLGWTSQRPRAETLSEMESLLRVLILPYYAERELHTQLLNMLCTTGRDSKDATKAVFRALHAYFQVTKFAYFLVYMKTFEFLKISMLM